VTFDGDVWVVPDIHAIPREYHWHRFASGLHEPQSVRVVDGQILVFTRTGIMRLRDRDGEADRYENFCNVFTQTAEIREFAMDIDLHPDGSILIAKGGQQIGSSGRHGGTVLKISKDGRGYELLARGLREPFLCVHPAVGFVSVSDQQGNWVPTTPLLNVEPGDDFGFRDPARRLRCRPRCRSPGRRRSPPRSGGSEDLRSYRLRGLPFDRRHDDRKGRPVPKRHLRQ
jgi:hypothetical protein